MYLRISGIIEESLIDGPGIRSVVFLQGCPFKCSGCHNLHAKDPAGGELLHIEDIFFDVTKVSGVDGVTFSGGEPFCQALPLAMLGRRIKKEGLNILTYTGYVFEYLWQRQRSEKGYAALLRVSDLLIDGPYRKEERDLSLAFRGSCNQRILDLPVSLRVGRPVEYENV